MQEMRTQHDRDSRLRARGNRVPHLLDARRIETGERFVEDQYRRVVQQSARDRELLFHAARERARQRLEFVTEFELREQWRNALLGIRDSIQPRDEPEMLLHGEIVEQMRFVRNEGELALRLHGLDLDVMIARC